MNSFSRIARFHINDCGFLRFLVQLTKNFISGKFKILNSYSQGKEDYWLNYWLPEDNGFYLDIGSGQPIIGSNSYLFYKKGWNGLLFDPIPGNFALSKILRRRDKVYKACISNVVERVDFWEFQPYEYSTLSRNQATKVLENNWARLKRIHKIDTLAIQDFELNISPVTPSFLSIDTEGLDYLILSSIDWSKFLPRLVCVEGGDSRQDSEIGKLLHSKGYKVAKKLKLSTIYLHSDFNAK